MIRRVLLNWHFEGRLWGKFSTYGFWAYAGLSKASCKSGSTGITLALRYYLGFLKWEMLKTVLMVKKCVILRHSAVCETVWQQWRVLVNILGGINYYTRNISGLGAAEAWLVCPVE
jgi:hypothetical protein